MYSAILVPLDGSALSEGALPTAKALARKFSSRLVLVRAAWFPAVAMTEPQEDQISLARECDAYLNGLATTLRGEGYTVDTTVPQTPAEQGILAAIQLFHAELVVMTTHGRSGLGRWVYGSVAEAVLNQSPVPVWLVRAWGAVAPTLFEKTPLRLLVPLDGSEFAEVVLPHAARLAHSMGAALVLMRAIAPLRLPADPLVAQALLEQAELENEETTAKYLADLAAPLRAEGVTVQTAVRLGAAARAILEEAWASDISLIIMATHGRTGLERVFLGSVAMDVLRRGTTPLLLIHPASFGKPGLAMNDVTEGSLSVV